MPSKRERREAVREVQCLPFVFHGPRENERRERDPTRPRHDSETEQQHREKKRGDEEGRRIYDGRFRDRHQQKQERERRRERGNISLNIFRFRKILSRGEERHREKERAGASGDDQESAQIQIGRADGDPEKRREESQEQRRGDCDERTADQRHTDRNEIENKETKPDRG